MFRPSYVSLDYLFLCNFKGLIFLSIYFVLITYYFSFLEILSYNYCFYLDNFVAKGGNLFLGRGTAGFSLLFISPISIVLELKGYEIIFTFELSLLLSDKSIVLL